MKLTFVSDTHNRHDEIDTGTGDVLFHCGDATGQGSFREISNFLKWYAEQDYAHKILIAGNHDWGFEREPGIYEKMCEDLGITYLNDSGVTIKCFDTGSDIKVWGSPVQPEFCNWAFNRSIYNSHPRYAPIKPHWDMIPDDTNILLTHGPPWEILDRVMSFLSTVSGGDEFENVGCPHLKEAILDRIKPEIHAFGHIHEEHGQKRIDDTNFINAAQLDDQYSVAYKPVSVLWEDVQKSK